MKKLSFIVMMLFMSQLHAEYRKALDPAVVSYAEGLLHVDVSEKNIQVKERTTVSGTNVFGVVYSGETAYIFVAERREGKLYEIAKSDAFSYSAMNSELEGISVISENEFSVSLSYHGACGGGSKTYKVIKRKKLWRLAGLNTASFQCSENGDDSVGPNSDNVSINYLSGLVINTEVRNSVPVSNIRDHHRFPVIPLSSLKLDELEQ